MKLIVQLLFAAAVQLRYVCSQSFAPATWSMAEPVAVYYCPFNVQAELTTDLSDINIRYTPSETYRAVSGHEAIKCYVRVVFAYEPTANVAAVREIEYTSSKGNSVQGRIETKTVWDGTTGPVSRQRNWIP
jgi:hypothetical protein